MFMTRCTRGAGCKSLRGDRSTTSCEEGLMQDLKWEYCTVEWLWDVESIRCILPDGDSFQQRGSYSEVVDVLTRLGHEGWEAV